MTNLSGNKINNKDIIMLVTSRFFLQKSLEESVAMIEASEEFSFFVLLLKMYAIFI